jgi:pimeloyl-ACP methyl ester carboxylesterase
MADDGIVTLALEHSQFCVGAVLCEPLSVKRGDMLVAGALPDSDLADAGQCAIPVAQDSYRAAREFGHTDRAGHDDICPILMAGSLGIMPCMSKCDAQYSPAMHVVQDGPQQAPPLLLIHGSGASGAFWSPVVPALAGHHHVIRVDLPGCGQSAPARSYDVPDQAGQVAALLDDLGLGPVAVAGHSSGGYVATALAEQRPDLVRSLVLISSGPSPEALLAQPLLLRVLLAPPLGPLLWLRRSDGMIRKGIRTTAARPVDVPDDMVAGLRSITYRSMRTVLRRNTAYIAERSVPERLAGLEVPVLVIFGAADPRWDPSSAHQYDAVPKARVELLPGVGHEPMLEAPETTSKLLLDFTATGR